MGQTKLLVIDDEEAIVEWIKKTYADKGYITFGAADGITAIEIFKKEKPDICLIDVHMPFSPINGIETLKRIKEVDKNAICIMVTRISEKKEVEDARKLGALHYVIKPLTFEELNEAVTDGINLLKKGNR